MRGNGNTVVNEMPVDFRPIVRYNMACLGYAVVDRDYRDDRGSVTVESMTTVLPIRTI